MPRGEKYPEEIRAEARRLRREEGWSLKEISDRLGPRKHTITAWVRDIILTPEQYVRLREREIAATSRNQALAAEVRRKDRLKRIQLEKTKAEHFLDGIEQQQQMNQVAAAMLYLAEGAKGDGAFSFGNSNPQVIKYWLYLLRSSFQLDEAKFSLQIGYRYDQDHDELLRYWIGVTGITRHIKGNMDSRTDGKPTKRLEYKGVCKVQYYDVALRRYLDALAAGLIERAVGAQQ